MCGGCTGPRDCDDEIGHIHAQEIKNDGAVTAAQALEDLDAEYQKGKAAGLISDADIAQGELDAEMELAVGILTPEELEDEVRRSALFRETLAGDEGVELEG